MLPTGDRPSSVASRPVPAGYCLLDKSAGVGCSPSLIWQRLNLSRAGECDKGLIRAATQLGLADQIAGGEISTAAADASALQASATSTSALGSSQPAEHFSQPAHRCQQPTLRAHTGRAVTNLRSGFKVRDSQNHIHTTERKKQ